MSDKIRFFDTAKIQDYIPSVETAQAELDDIDRIIRNGIGAEATAFGVGMGTVIASFEDILPPQYHGVTRLVGGICLAAETVYGIGVRSWRAQLRNRTEEWEGWHETLCTLLPDIDLSPTAHKQALASLDEQITLSQTRRAAVADGLYHYQHSALERLTHDVTEQTHKKGADAAMLYAVRNMLDYHGRTRKEGAADSEKYKGFAMLEAVARAMDTAFPVDQAGDEPMLENWLGYVERLRNSGDGTKPALGRLAKQLRVPDHQFFL